MYVPFCSGNCGWVLVVKLMEMNSNSCFPGTVYRWFFDPWEGTKQKFPSSPDSWQMRHLLVVPSWICMVWFRGSTRMAKTLDSLLLWAYSKTNWSPQIPSKWWIWVGHLFVLEQSWDMPRQVLYKKDHVLRLFRLVGMIAWHNARWKSPPRMSK